MSFNPKWPRWPMWIAVACELTIVVCFVRLCMHARPGESLVGLATCAAYGYFSATWALFSGAFGDDA